MECSVQMLSAHATDETAKKRSIAKKTNNSSQLKRSVRHNYRGWYAAALRYLIAQLTSFSRGPACETRAGELGRADGRDRINRQLSRTARRNGALSRT